MKTESSTLDAIAAEGAALEAEHAIPGALPGPGGELAAPVDPTQQETEARQVALWAMIPKTFGSMLAMAMPELKTVYTDDACNLWGQAMQAVAVKHGWSADSSPEVALLFVSAPFVVQTGLAIRARKEAARIAREAGGKAAPASIPGQPAPSNGNGQAVEFN